MPDSMAWPAEPMGFNPRPAVRPGDAMAYLSRWVGLRCFNPRPAVRPGDAGYYIAATPAEMVSIRARP